MSSRDGKIENSSGSFIFMLISNIIIDKDIFIIIMTSNKNGGMGIIISNTITITKAATALFKIRFMSYLIFLFSLYTYTRISATAP